MATVVENGPAGRVGMWMLGIGGIVALIVVVPPLAKAGLPPLVTPVIVGAVLLLCWMRPAYETVGGHIGRWVKPVMVIGVIALLQSLLLMLAQQDEVHLKQLADLARSTPAEQAKALALESDYMLDRLAAISPTMVKHERDRRRAEAAAQAADERVKANLVAASEAKKAAAALNAEKQEEAAAKIAEAHKLPKDGELLYICQEAVRAKLSHPSTAAFGWTGNDIDDVNGLRRVTLALTARNSFNLEVGLTGICDFAGPVPTTVTVFEADR